MADIIQARFASRPRTGMWMFDIYFVNGTAWHIPKMGRSQADALTQVIDELQDAPDEVKRIDCIPLMPGEEIAVINAGTAAGLEVVGGAA